MRPSPASGASTDDQVRAIVAHFVFECDRRRSPVRFTAGSWLERDLGIYSLERVELLLRLEEAFDVAIPEKAASAAMTVGDLVALIDGQNTAPDEHRRESRAEAWRGTPAATRGSLVFTAYVAGLLAVVTAAAWPLLHVFRGERAARLIRSAARLVLRATACVPEVAGLRHLDGIGNAVLVANHESYVDSVILLATLPILPTMVVNERLPGAPVIGTCVEAAGYLCVDRTSTPARLRGADALSDALAAGASLLVFPEGTFPDRPGLLPFRLGAFAAAAAAHRPVVPITLRGTRRMLPTGARLLRRSRIAVTVHPPIYPAAGGWAEALRLRETARHVMAESTGAGHGSGRDACREGS